MQTLKMMQDNGCAYTKDYTLPDTYHHLPVS